MPPLDELIAKVRAAGVALPPGRVRADGYGDSAELSAELIDLIRSGPKRAGTGLLWAMEHDGAEYAAVEGEGDGSLAFWRDGHWRFFTRECRRIGREPSADMPVVCARFELLAVLPPVR